MKMKHLFLYFIALSFSLTIIFSCEKESVPETKKEALLAHKVNQFSYALYRDIYLWSEDIPTLDPEEYDDEQVFFEKMIHADDQWSNLTSDINALEDKFSGTGDTYGCSYFLGKFTGTTEYFGIVKYVYADSPAKNAGLERGDVVIKIDGSSITADNLMDLYYSSSITLGLGQSGSGGISDLNKTVSMTAIKMIEDPILESKVFETSGVGYIHYTSYLLNSHKDLNNVFEGFKEKGVKELILDLRYNGGGYSLTSLFLSSLLTTKQALDAKDIAIKQLWNPSYNAYMLSEGVKNEERFTSELKSKLSESQPEIIDYVTGNLDLKRLYVLVSEGSASASESTIASLELYLDVILIGGKTAGKFCGGSLFKPSDLKMNDTDLDNWGSYTMIYRFANKEGVTNCIGGYVPDHEVTEDAFNLYPIGSEKDPQIAKALALITGVATPASQYTTPAHLGYELIEHSRNMLDGKLIVLSVN